MFRMNLIHAGENRYSEDSYRLRDMKTGQPVDIISPAAFRLEAVLLDSAYYVYQGREYRFRLSEARKIGLKIS